MAFSDDFHFLLTHFPYNRMLGHSGPLQHRFGIERYQSRRGEPGSELENHSSNLFKLNPEMIMLYWYLSQNCISSVSVRHLWSNIYLIHCNFLNCIVERFRSVYEWSFVYVLWLLHISKNCEKKVKGVARSKEPCDC